MDPALLLLWRLRTRAFFRRLGRNLRKPKGILLTLVGLLVFVPWMLSIAFTPKAAIPWNPEGVRRFGPLILLVYAALSMVLSSGERVLFFSPAEIDFLFPGPFTRRGLLAYKAAGAVLQVMFSALFITVAFLRSSRSLPAAYLAIVLVMLFFQFLGMAVGLASNTVAAFATSVRRRVVVVGLIGLVVATAWSAGAEVFSLPPEEALARVEASPALRAATWPFKPFIFVYTSEGFSAAMAGWTSVCLGMVAAMVGVVFAIDAQYFETSAASSARIYAQLQKMRQGGGLMPGRGVLIKPKRARLRLGMLPWLGGVGPVLWRQVATALREPVRLTIITLVLIAPGVIPLLASRHPDATPIAQVAAFAFAGISLYLAGIFSAMVAFDFRGDVDRMEELKALPIHSVPLVIGQLATPVLIFTLPAWVAFTLASPYYGAVSPADFALLAMIAPITALVVGIDNLLFLLFPTRTTQANAADFTSMGRQVLLVLAKLLVGGATIGLAALVGWLVHYLTGGSRLTALLAALAVATLAAASLVPLMALAFRRYDVASDTPA